ncbi:MAG: EFR1 family ferrodoxin [Spirochaetaceae bacterium]|jgi:ferredoxin|nr:EFR1 family ferrodoxin [Spirochaetaceae bacterium]
MTKIYCFSGTGNTLWSATKIAQTLGSGGELFNIACEARKPSVLIEAERVVFLFPSYAYQMPQLVRRFIDKAEIRAAWTGAVVTYGSDQGGALAEASRALRRKSIRLSFAGRIPSVENFIPLFGSPSAKKIEERIAEQKNATERIAQSILNEETNSIWTFRPLSALVSFLFRSAKGRMAQAYKLGAECNGCALCVRLCPARAIRLEDGKPVFSAGCEQCQACLTWCPRRAISFARLKAATPRYHHPEIELSQMLG